MIGTTQEVGKGKFKVELLNSDGNPGWCGSVDWSVVLYTKRMRVQFWLGHIPRLWV